MKIFFTLKVVLQFLRARLEALRCALKNVVHSKSGASFLKVGVPLFLLAGAFVPFSFVSASVISQTEINTATTTSFGTGAIVQPLGQLPNGTLNSIRIAGYSINGGSCSVQFNLWNTTSSSFENGLSEVWFDFPIISLTSTPSYHTQDISNNVSYQFWPSGVVNNQNIVIDDSKYYWLYIYSTNDCSVDNAVLYGSVGGGFNQARTQYSSDILPVNNLYFQLAIDESLPSAPSGEPGIIDDISTRFISISPEYGSTTPSGLPVGVSYELYLGDEASTTENLYVELKSDNYMSMGTPNNYLGVSDPPYYYYKIPISNIVGSHMFATTTYFTDSMSNMVDGRTNLTFTLGKSYWLFFSSDLVSTSTRFQIGGLRPDEELSDWVGGVIGGNNGTSTASTTLDNVISSCTTLSGFDLFLCSYYLLVPSKFDLSHSRDPLVSGSGGILENFQDSFLSKAPWGYLTRLSLLVATSTRIIPPALTYTFGSSSPSEIRGLTYSMQIFNHFDELESIRADDGSNKNLWEIVDPYFRLIVGLSALFVVLSDLVGLGISGGKGKNFPQRSITGKYSSDIENMKIKDYSGLSERDWETLKRNRLL